MHPALGFASLPFANVPLCRGVLHILRAEVAVVESFASAAGAYDTQCLACTHLAILPTAAVHHLKSCVVQQERLSVCPCCCSPPCLAILQTVSVHLEPSQSCIFPQCCSHTMPYSLARCLTGQLWTGCQALLSGHGQTGFPYIRKVLPILSAPSDIAPVSELSVSAHATTIASTHDLSRVLSRPV